MFRDRVARHYRLSDCIGLFIPSVSATDKDAGGLPVLQQASMPRQRLRSIPRESATQRIGISSAGGEASVFAARRERDAFTEFPFKAALIAHSYTARPAALMGTICRVIITDGGDCWSKPSRHSDGN
jgi:hypothetical protein